MKSMIRAVIPQRVRQAARRLLREVPVRLRDLPADLADTINRNPGTLPPARLRSRVGLTSSRREFEVVARIGADAIREAWERAGKRNPRRALDFGCGPGRVARVLAPSAESFAGVDVDADAIRWCAQHLQGQYAAIDPRPPLPFDDQSFDVVYAISVFTHFDEPLQDLWLAELSRVLAPDGLLIATTHAPDLQFGRPDLALEIREQLAKRGFAFARGATRFNDDSAFHAESYIRSHWTRWFTLLEYRRFGLGNFQDVVVLRRATTMI